MNTIAANLRLGGGAGSSTMPAVVMGFLVLTILLLFILPRHRIAIPFLLIIFLTPFGEQIYVGGLHLFINRILILCGWLRIAKDIFSSKIQLLPGGFNLLDKVFLIWAFSRATATFLEYRETSALVNQGAFLWDVIGGYFLWRYLIRNEDDINCVIKTFALIVALLSVTMVNEKVAGLNVFGYLGGRFTPFVRDGAIRSQATFAGPVAAGTCAATLFCLFVWLIVSGRSRFMGILGAIGSAVMTLTSASSTPAMALPAGLLAAAFWPLRRHMRYVRWTISLILLGLHLVMKAPVWMLINHVDIIGGSSGYHRAELIDTCVRHFTDWWLIGVTSTREWGWDMWDLANQFVAEAEQGGLATLVSFILLVSWSFGRLSRAGQAAGGKRQWLCWLLGCTMFSQVVSFFGISFSDNSQVAWFAFLAMISVATIPIAARPTWSDGNWEPGEMAAAVATPAPRPRALLSDLYVR